MSDILESKLVFQLLVGFVIFISFFLIAKIYLIVKTSDWSIFNVVLVSLSFLALVLIFIFTFTERQRLALGVFVGGLIIIAGGLLIARKIIKR
jgi:glucan phosphoethanolaminetransferase (alkaline phosphatase superfamily)